MEIPRIFVSHKVMMGKVHTRIDTQSFRQSRTISVESTGPSSVNTSFCPLLCAPRNQHDCLPHVSDQILKGWGSFREVWHQVLGGREG